MKFYNICLVSFSDVRGGAAKAALRIKRALGRIGVDTSYVVAEKKMIGAESIGPCKMSFFYHFILRLVSYSILKLMKTKNPVKHSLNLFSSRFVLRQIDKYSLIHFHWINNDTVSIRALARISQGKNIVVTLHDEWFYCGAEHYAPIFDSSDCRFVDGYKEENSTVGWIDLNRIIWQMKFKQFKFLRNVLFTVPSTWMLKRAKSSMLLSDKQVVVVPNPIPTDIFCCSFSQDSRPSLGIHIDDFVIAFCALSSQIKGYDKLKCALDILYQRMTDVDRNRTKLLVIGDTSEKENLSGFHTVYVGNIDSEEKMAAMYNMASITVVPSLVESFGQVAAESLACATPVVAFNCSGLTDIVDHRKSGYLAKPYDVEDLACGMMWLFKLNKIDLDGLGENGVLQMKERFSEIAVAEKFKAIYDELL